jgi:OmpA-OmpF porin, OOP family
MEDFMIRTGKVGQLLLLGLLACGAEAAEPVATGFYLGASAGAAKHDVGNGGARGTILVGIGGFSGGIVQVARTGLETDEESTGWRGLAGYRFNRYLAAELEYLDFGSSEIHETYVIDDFLPFPAAPLTIEQDFLTDVSGPAVSALGKLPIGERFELFLRAGVLFADSKVRMAQRFGPSSITYSDRVLIGGAGVDWNFAGRWSARLEYQRSKDIEPNLDIGESHVELLSLGVLFKL